MNRATHNGMKIGIDAPRCAFAIRFGENLITRCFQKPGHNGPCQGKGLKKFPYQRIKWFRGDGREFITDREHEYAWSERKRNA